MNKDNITALTEKQLELLSGEQKIDKLNYYLSLLNVASHEMVSFEEKLWVFKSIIGNFLYFSNNTYSQFEKYLHYLDSKYLEDAKFYYLFVYCDYCYDLEGNGEHRPLSISPLSDFKPFDASSNQVNVRFLNKIYVEWSQELNRKNCTGLLKKIVKEYQLMRRNEKEAFDKQNAENQLWKIKEKQLTLFYKYIYLKGLILFNGKTEFSLLLSGQSITFDVESYCHIHRHFAQALKPDLLQKSYIRQDFSPDNIVQMLSEIFLKISESDNKIFFLEKEYPLFFELNQVVYQLWIKKNRSHFRISSFYPVERIKDGYDFRKLHRIELSENLYYFS